MEQSANQESRLASLEAQINEQEAFCKQKKDHLDLIQAETLQKQFDLTDLNHPTFFQRHFGNLRKKKDEAWAAYQAAVLKLEQAKSDFAEANQNLQTLQAEYRAHISGK